MNYRTKQKPQETNSTLIIILTSITIALFALVYAQGQHAAANMAIYAEQNNCEWSATGTFYGDDRDFICK